MSIYISLPRLRKASGAVHRAGVSDDVIVTSEVDGMPQRVVRNELVDRLEGASGLTRLFGALRSALLTR